MLAISNYDVNSPDLKIDWTFDLDMNNATSLVQYSRNRTKLSLFAGALFQDTSYTLTVTITNIKYPVATLSKQYPFTTGNTPK
jgi:hypothetical protein